MTKQDLVIRALQANPAILIADTQREMYPALIMSRFSDFMHIYVAPKDPLSELEALQKLMMGIAPELSSNKDDFSLNKTILNKKETVTGLRFGCVYFDEEKSRTIVRVYPNIETARGAAEGKILSYELSSQDFKKYGLQALLT